MLQKGMDGFIQRGRATRDLVLISYIVIVIVSIIVSTIIMVIATPTTRGRRGCRGQNGGLEAFLVANLDLLFH